MEAIDNQNNDQNSTLTSTNSSSKAQIKKHILTLANDLLKICRTEPNNRSSQCDSIPDEIKSIKQLKSDIYVYFYENICSTELIDKKWPSKNQQDEIHNLQSVIDSLSLDVLHEDLSHLTAEAILGTNSNQKPDLVSIEYLLDILRCINEWITSKTETTVNTTEEVKKNQNNNQGQNELNNIESNKNSLNEKYLNLEQKFEETIEMTKQALNINPIDDPNKQEEKEDDDIFKKYMKEKELEYSLNKCKRLVEDIEIIKSSSGNSSYRSDVSTSTNSLNEEMFNLAINLNQEQKHVKFKVDSRTRSNSPVYSNKHVSSKKQSTRRKIAQKQENSNIQTVDNELNQIRNNLKNNLNIESYKIERLLSNIYSEDLKDAQALMHSSLKKLKNKSDLTNDLFLNAHGQSIKKPNLIPSARSKSKGVLLPSSRSLTNFRPIQRSSSLTSLNSSRDLSNKWNFVTNKSLSLSKDPAKKFYSRYTIGEDGILNCLLQEFPYLYTSPETIHYLWQRHSKHIETLTKEQKELEQKYLNKTRNGFIDDDLNSNRAELYLKETNCKQEKLMDIMRKELEHMERQQDLKRKQLVENSLKAKTREQRFQNAKVKKYFEEFRLQQRAKMLKQKTSEELIFKKLFNESLKIQKERMLDLKKYAKEKNDINLKQQMNQIVSIENFYKNKFDLLNEEIRKEKEETQLRENAQHLVLTKMKAQVKNKLESDIRDLQDQMCQDKDFLYWRQMDADRLKKDVQKASYFKVKNN